MPTDKSIANIP